MIKIIIAAVGVLVVIFGGLFLYTSLTPGSGSALSTDGSNATSTSGTDTASLVIVPTTTPSTAGSQSDSSVQPVINNQNIMSATLHTSMGDITIEFYGEQAPKTVANFIKLAQSGYYDSVKFHRVIQGFMDQAGDPLTKDDSQEARWGTGGPGYTIPDEISPSLSNTAGTVAMANTGQPNTGGSQFFINAVDNKSLDGGYTVFGKVTAGMDVVTAINKTPVDSADRPLTPVVINSVTLK